MNKTIVTCQNNILSEPRSRHRTALSGLVTLVPFWCHVMLIYEDVCDKGILPTLPTINIMKRNTGTAKF